MLLFSYSPILPAADFAPRQPLSHVSATFSPAAVLLCHASRFTVLPFFPFSLFRRLIAAC